MRGVFPGKPRATPQAVCTTKWNQTRLVLYIAGNALVISDQPHHLVQTIYHDNEGLLDAVAIDKATGKIAILGSSNVYIYKPYGVEDASLKWSLQFSFAARSTSTTLTTPDTLSWGPSEELLIGSTELRLYQTTEDSDLIWQKQLASPPRSALLSPDGSLIASIANYDRLVKIWRRLSFGDGDVRFDYSYLPHPALVTTLQWKDKQEEGHDGKNILYTICTDGKARIWSCIDPHGLQVLQMWAEIDLQSSIQPRDVNEISQTMDRYVFFLDGEDFKKVAEAMQTNGNRDPVLEHLIEATQHSPDLCIVLDRLGSMCVWGMKNIGIKAGEPSDIFNIIYVENVDMLPFDNLSVSGTPYQLSTFCDISPAPTMSVICHSFDGTITWLEGAAIDVLDPSRQTPRFRSKALWTGHEGSIEKINRTNKGRAVVSRTARNENIVWKQPEEQDGIALARCSSFVTEDHIYRTCILDDGKFVANLHPEVISIWDTTNFTSEKIAFCNYELDGKPLCLILLASSDTSPSMRYLATISSVMTGVVWQLRIPQLEAVNGSSHYLPAGLEQFCTFDLGSQSDLAYVLPVDPAGSVPIVSGFLDVFAKDVALSYSTNGIIRTWAAKIEPHLRKVNWLATATVHTGIDNPSLASGSSTRKVALVDSSRNNLTIWDTSNVQLEYEKQYTVGESIQDLDWTSTPDDQSVLAVGFSHKVMVLAQIRYDYLDRRPSWAPIREIHIRESTPHPIGDSTWLGSGSLVIGAGNQLFVYDKFITAHDESVKELAISTRDNASVDLFDVVSLLNGPLPIFHPQLLSQCILAGKLSLVQKVIVNLGQQIKYYTEGDALDSSASITLEEWFEEQEVSVAFSKKKIKIKIK